MYFFSFLAFSRLSNCAKKEMMMNENSRGNNMGRRGMMDPNNSRGGMRNQYLNPSGPGPIPSIGKLTKCLCVWQGVYEERWRFINS